MANAAPLCTTAFMKAGCNEPARTACKPWHAPSTLCRPKADRPCKKLRKSRARYAVRCMPLLATSAACSVGMPCGLGKQNGDVLHLRTPTIGLMHCRSQPRRLLANNFDAIAIELLCHGRLRARTGLGIPVPPHATTENDFTPFNDSMIAKQVRRRGALLVVRVVQRGSAQRSQSQQDRTRRRQTVRSRAGALEEPPVNAALPLYSYS
jgi:hypothetical protein